MTDHFNKLTAPEQERLSILIEEAGEVIQAACKILRHGYESYNPKIENSETNREALQRELGDLMHAMLRMTTASDLDYITIQAKALSKPERIQKYLHHN